MTRLSPAASDCEGGFTLLELLAVLTILAVSAALVLPRTSGTRQSAVVRAAAVDLVAGLKAARAGAMTSSRTQTFTLDPQSRRYWVDNIVAPKRLPAGVAISIEPDGDTSAPIEFAFRPDGSADDRRIRLSSPRQSATVSIDWLTGCVDMRLGD